MRSQCGAPNDVPLSGALHEASLITEQHDVPDHDEDSQGDRPASVWQTVARYQLRLVREAVITYYGGPICDQPERAAPFLHQILHGYDREVMGALLLNQRNQAIGHTLAYIGTLTRVSAEPRGLLVPALLANATGVILFHNHPSGNPAPSPGDINVTRRIADAGDILGIKVLDHIIIGEVPDYSSLRQQGYW